MRLALYIGQSYLVLDKEGAAVPGRLHVVRAVQGQADRPVLTFGQLVAVLLEQQGMVPL